MARHGCNDVRLLIAVATGKRGGGLLPILRKDAAHGVIKVVMKVFQLDVERVVVSLALLKLLTHCLP